MTHRLIYLIGAPGSGKSALMARLTEHLERIPFYDPRAVVAHDQLFDADGVMVGAEIGIRRELFSGTDALPSSIIEKAVPWIKSAPYELVLAEGARLANKRFILAAIDGGYTPTLVLLDHDQQDEWRKARAELIGREQNASWVQGRLTASRNLAQWAEEQAIEVLRGAPDDVYDQLVELISTNG